MRFEALQEAQHGDAAEPAAREWLAESTAAGADAVRAEAELALAATLSRRERRAEALALLRGALDRLDAGPGWATAELTRRVLLALADNEIRNGDFAAGERRLERAETLRGEPPEARDELRLLSLRGMLAQFRGEPHEAVRLNREAVEVARHLGDSVLLGNRLGNLGMALIELHDYAGAIEILEPLLDSDDFSARRLALFGLGVSLFELNRHQEAWEVFDRLGELAKERGALSLQSVVEGEKGLVLQALGDADAAIASYDRAIELCRRVGDRANEVVWLQNKGALLRDEKRFAEALTQLERALEIEVEIQGSRSRPNLLKQIGQCRVGLGNDRTAEGLFEEALAAARNAGDSKVIWETERERARLFERQGRIDEAARSFEAALDAIESMRGSLRLESFKADFFEDKVEVFEEAVELLIEHGPDGVERAFAVSERARARAFLDSLVESRAFLHETLPDELRREEQELHRRIAELQARLRGGAGGEADRAALEQAERSLDALELRVHTERSRYRELQGLEPAGLAEVQARLDPGEALVSYLLAEPASHAWIVRQDRVDHVAIAGRAEIQRAVGESFAAFLDPSAEPRQGELSAMLIEPLVGALTGIESMLIVPSGVLFNLPFETLPWRAQGERQVLVDERFTVSYWPSASTLVELRARPTTPASPRLLVVANALYGGQASAERAADLRSLATLGPLPHTRAEARALRREFGKEAVLLLGERASESALEGLDLESFSLLHFATHGFIDPTSASRSGLVLSAEQPPGSAEDGILQPREVLRLRLAADLVTLSACQSALGELVTGEGMVSLARSFFYAGTDTVVASLWNVNDRASAELMSSFYRHLHAGAPKAEALRRARSELRAREEYRHPYYWAPWILLGRGEDGVAFPPARSRWISWAGGGAALLLGVGWIVRRRRRAGNEA